MLNDMGCVIYVAQDKQNLEKKLQQFFHEKDSFGNYIANSNEIVILENMDADPMKCREFPDGFQNFASIIEIYPDESKQVAIENQATFISMMLEVLWKQNIPAIAACDYEDKLIKNGGYKNKDIPWVSPEKPS